MFEQFGHPAMERHDATADEDGAEQRNDRPDGMHVIAPFLLDAGPARDHQSDEQRHVHEINPRRLVAGAQLQIGRNRPGGQKSDDPAGLAATEGRQQNRFRDQSRREGKPADLRPHCGNRCQKAKQGRQRQQGSAELVDDEQFAADQARQQPPSIVRLRGLEKLKVLPGGDGQEQSDTRNDQAPFATDVTVATAGHPDGAQHGNENREFQPGEV